MLIDQSYIQKAKEMLGDTMAFIIAEELGMSEQFDEKNMKMCCPFHDEDHASFIWNKKALNFHCFGSCGRSYDILDIYMSKGFTYIEACQKLFELVDMPYSFGEHKVKTKRQYKYPKKVECTDKAKVYEYLNLRKISPETVDYLDICQDEKGNIVFNYYDLNDCLTMVKYRPSHKISKGENKNWCQPGADTAALLFNMNRINVAQPLLITSGELDCAAAIEAGWRNAVSIPLGDQNTQWVEENFDWLEQFETIIICPDNDESGYKYCKDIIPRLGGWRCKVAVVPEGCKDINEVLYKLGKEAVIEFIVNAHDSPITSVVDLSEVEDIDLDKIDGITFGIKDLDKELMKLFFGTLTIVSGQPGSGKTSFLDQVICQSIDQGRSCWVYSKELPEWMTKNWLNFILAGKRHITEKETANGSIYYRVNPAAKQRINEKYKGKWYVYRDDCDNKLDSLIDSMTSVVRKCGVKLLILDNMMTIDIGSNDNNENQKQTETINKLIQFAMKYEVAVVLVVHPRKLISTSDVGIYDIYGSSNIVNLAHRTIGLRRVTKEEKAGVAGKNGKWASKPNKYDVMVSVIKDRMRGKAGFTTGLFYDTASRRFFSNKEEYVYQYGWDDMKYERELELPEALRQEEEVFGVIDEYE